MLPMMILTSEIQDGDNLNFPAFWQQLHFLDRDVYLFLAQFS